ncbi:non-canonical purine NTP pyrophosphatase, RdgB/HAM1 family [Chitinophagaceae bacterium IBVUCB1]|nr:non-canonical purine NTP pyrophosphatase, RdgB/HAM1 family [Chitinophagaceae bacterium IBVUCB1]
MKELVIASNNKGKIKEIREMIADVNLLSLQDIGFTDEIDEPFQTFEENALVKASTIYRFCGKNVFADDSGICANALHGEPGVSSAHYSGSRHDEANLHQLLTNLHGKDDRTGYYKAVICLIWDDETYFFEGICEGTIIEESRGQGGFGYDPIFVPNGYDKTFAELPPHIKNEISHRGKAVAQMVAFIKDKLQAE